jgi:hypothetical protein
VTITLNTAAKNAVVNSLLALIDAANPTPGVLRIYAHTPTEYVLAELTFSLPSFALTSTGTLTANSIVSDTDTGGLPEGITATDMDVRDGNGNLIFTGSVGLAGDGADIILNNVVFYEHGICSISDMIIQET